MTNRKSIAVLAIVTAAFAVACETEEDPGGDGGLGYMGDTSIRTEVAPAGDERLDY